MKWKNRNLRELANLICGREFAEIDVISEPRPF